MTTPTKEQIEAAAKAIFDTAVGPSKWNDAFYSEERDGCFASAKAALAAAAEVRPADISCPFCGGENGKHDHNCGLKKTAAAAEIGTAKAPKPRR